MIYIIWIMLYTPNSIPQHWLGFSQNAVVPQNKVQTDLMTRSRQIWWLSMLFLLFKWIDSNSLVMYSFENLMKITVPLSKYINNLANNLRGLRHLPPWSLLLDYLDDIYNIKDYPPFFHSSLGKYRQNLWCQSLGPTNGIPRSKIRHLAQGLEHIDCSINVSFLVFQGPSAPYENSQMFHAFPLVSVLLLLSSPTWITPTAMEVDLVVSMALMPLILLAWTWIFSPSVRYFSILFLMQHLNLLPTYGIYIITSLQFWARDKIYLVI